MHPSGGIRLDGLNRLGQRDRWRQQQEDVHMVAHAAYRDGLHTQSPRNSADECPKARLDFVGNPSPSFFGAEHAMNAN